MLSQVRNVRLVQSDKASGCLYSVLAEGQGRDSAREFVHHLSFAYGSLMEAETQLQIAANLGYIEKREVDRLLNDAAEIGRMLNGLSRSIRNGSD